MGLYTELTLLKFHDTTTLERLESISQQLQATINNRLFFDQLLSKPEISAVLLKYPFILLRQLNASPHWLTDLP